eukprot:274536_1
MSSDCTLLELVLSSVYIFIVGILFLISIHITYKFLQRIYKAEDKPPLLVSSTGIIFLVFATLTLFGLIIPWRLSVCYPQILYLSPLYVTIYCIQSYLLLLLLFFRLYFVFCGTIYGLSKLTLKIYTILFCLLPFFFSIAVYQIGIEGRWNNPLMVTIIIIGYIYIIIFASTISILFIHKLLIMARSINANNDSLIIVVTKTSILSFISSFMTIIPPLVLMVIFIKGSDSIYYQTTTQQYIVRFIIDILFAIDVFTNFICIVLSYKFFNHSYLVICGNLDAKCKEYWFTKSKLMKASQHAVSNSHTISV